MFCTTLKKCLAPVGPANTKLSVFTSKLFERIANAAFVPTKNPGAVGLYSPQLVLPANLWLVILLPNPTLCDPSLGSKSILPLEKISAPVTLVNYTKERNWNSTNLTRRC